MLLGKLHQKSSPYLTDRALSSSSSTDMRELRFFPFRTLVEVTCQTFQSRFLLKPTPEICDLILGVLGRAQRRYGVEIHALAFLSNHYHLLLTIRDGLQLSGFMGYVNSNIAREVGRVIGWEDKFWSGRYKAVAVSDEEEAQVHRLRYLLAQGTKELLVQSPFDWPGIHCAHALVHGAPIEGTWYDRTLEYTARRVKKSTPKQFATREVVTLTPLPCWGTAPTEQVRQEIRALIAEIEREAAEERRLSRQPVLGAAAIRAQHPHHRPAHRDRTPGPLIHAASRQVRDHFIAVYSDFVACYRAAAEDLRAGCRTVTFSAGCFAPALGWIASHAPAGSG
ncbi:MAG: transposase [Thermoanaerobaculia bacterium]|nr:transposase [Thermoanaerobaculia bacterium]